MPIEVEIKIPGNLEKVRDRLYELKAIKLEDQVDHFDTYLNHPNRDFKQTDEALRIRRLENHQVELTYKGPKFNDKSKSRNELNIKIHDDEDTLSIIFDHLGFNVGGRVKKTREFWKYEGVLITLDNVEFLGEYVELEIVMEDISLVDQKVEELKAIAKTIGLDPNNHKIKSYLELIEDKLSRK